MSQSILEPTSKTKQFVYQLGGFGSELDRNIQGAADLQRIRGSHPLILDNLLVEDLTQAQTDSREALETLYEQNKDRQEDLYTEKAGGAFVKALNQAKEALKRKGQRPRSTKL